MKSNLSRYAIQVFGVAGMAILVILFSESRFDRLLFSGCMALAALTLASLRVASRHRQESKARAQAAGPFWLGTSLMMLVGAALFVAALLARNGPIWP
jgi:hypothetical protein